MTYIAYIFIIHYCTYINLVSKCFDECSYTKNKCEYIDNIFIYNIDNNRFQYFRKCRWYIAILVYVP